MPGKAAPFPLYECGFYTIVLIELECNAKQGHYQDTQRPLPKAESDDRGQWLFQCDRIYCLCDLSLSFPQGNKGGGMKEEEKKRTLLLPSELYRRLEERAKSTGFGSVYEYVIFILEEALKEGGKEKEMALTKEEEEEIKKGLRSLGYLE